MLVDGFYHADPHPGNLRWWNDKIYFLDMGMVGEVEPNVRELMLLLILAFAQKDARFLSEVVLLLGAGEGAGEMQDLEAFRRDLTSLVEKHGALSLKDIQLGPLIQEISEVAVRHDVRIPAELALAIKAMSQMQLAAGELDPTLNPFEVARSFGVRNALRQLGGFIDPQQIFYHLQKGKARVNRILESVESLARAMPGGRLQVQFRGLDHFEQTVRTHRPSTWTRPGDRCGHRRDRRRRGLAQWDDPRHDRHGITRRPARDGARGGYRSEASDDVGLSHRAQRVHESDCLGHRSKIAAGTPPGLRESPSRARVPLTAGSGSTTSTCA